jgi:hypothetical protein
MKVRTDKRLLFTGASGLERGELSQNRFAGGCGYCGWQDNGLGTIVDHDRAKGGM